MTVEQSKLVEDNHGLIYWYIIHRIDGDIDRWYDIIAIGLCKAAIHFDESKGAAFSTYAIRVMENEYRVELRKLNRHKSKLNFNAMSLQEIVTEEGDGVLEDIIPDTSINLEEEVIANITVHQLLESLSTREQRILSLTIDGMTQKDIANELGITQGHVSRILKKIKSRLE